MKGGSVSFDLLQPAPWRPDDTARDARDGKRPDDAWQPHPQGRPNKDSKPRR